MLTWTPSEYGHVAVGFTSDSDERKHDPGISESPAEIDLRLLLT